MNIQLSETEEFVDMKSTGNLGQVLIRYVEYFSTFPAGWRYRGKSITTADALNRCNNVLWISGAKDADGADVKMEG